MFVLLAVGCSSDATSSPPPDADSTTLESTTASPRATLSAGDTYVALGSSIASGFGISVQSTACGRSNRSYPNLIAARYGLALTDVSCGAASIPNVVDSPQGENPPQIDAVTSDTKLVTVSVGGNDIGYNGTAVGCGDPATVCTAPASLEEDLAATRAALPAMLDRIRSAAPDAIIVFVTYPREVPEGNCPELGFDDEEAALVGSMGARLEEVFVDIGRAEDLVFVDPYVEPGDHTGCAPAEQRWTAGNVADDGFAYHPTALGHRVMAEMIEGALGP